VFPLGGWGGDIAGFVTVAFLMVHAPKRILSFGWLAGGVAVLHTPSLIYLGILLCVVWWAGLA